MLFPLVIFLIVREGSLAIGAFLYRREKYVHYVDNNDDEFAPTLPLTSSCMDLVVGGFMTVYEVKVKATVTDTFRVIAENEYEAAERAELMFRNDNGDGLLGACFVVNLKHGSLWASQTMAVTDHI